MAPAKACAVCGKPTRYGDIVCSPAHQAEYEAKFAGHGESLRAAGFEFESGNIYRKDGVAVTTEQVQHVGLETTLRHHQQSVDVRSAA